VILAAALAAGEIFTLSFFLGPIALAAVLASFVALLGGGIAFQLIAFIAGSLGALALLRPIAVRHLRTPVRLRTGAAALVGARALVIERVDSDGGRVKIGGEEWSARAFFDDEVMEAGSRVEVARISGATALVHEMGGSP
jgi:membrane protein implicated in regulation of membrane protease activity